MPFAISQEEASRNFMKAALARYGTAEYLLKQTPFTADAKYLAGYSIECSLKALIIDAVPEIEFAAEYAKITSGSAMHKFEVLAAELVQHGRQLPSRIKEKFRLARFRWSTDLRYDFGTERFPKSEVRGFLKLARETIGWVGEELSWSQS